MSKHKKVTKATGHLAHSRKIQAVPAQHEEIIVSLKNKYNTAFCSGKSESDIIFSFYGASRFDLLLFKTSKYSPTDLYSLQ